MKQTKHGLIHEEEEEDDDDKIQQDTNQRLFLMYSK
jgi:hypothetical protein